MFQKYCLKISERNSQNYLTYSLYCRVPSVAPLQTGIRATCEGTFVLVPYYNVLFEFLGLFSLRQELLIELVELILRRYFGDFFVFLRIT